MAFKFARDEKDGFGLFATICRRTGTRGGY